MGCGGSKTVNLGPLSNKRKVCVDDSKHTLSTPPRTVESRESREDDETSSEFSVDVNGIDAATNVRAVVTRSILGESFGFGIGESAAGTVFVSDLVLGGAADGKLQVGDQIDRMNGVEIQSKSFDDVLRLSAHSFTLMLECTRLRTLKHPNPEHPPQHSPDDLRPPSPMYAGGGPKQPVISRAVVNVSITELIPNIQLVRRRSNFGKKLLSARPKVNSIQEVLEEEAENEDLGDEKFASQESLGSICVTLKRPAGVSTFGFSTAMLVNSSKVVISRIASNICNWGMLQVGDEVLSIDDKDVSEMSHKEIKKAISKQEQLRLRIVRPKKESYLPMLPTRTTRRGSVSMLFHRPGSTGRVFGSIEEDDLGGAGNSIITIPRPSPPKKPPPPPRNLIGGFNDSDDNSDLSMTWPKSSSSSSLANVLASASPKKAMLSPARSNTRPPVPTRSATSIGLATSTNSRSARQDSVSTIASNFKQKKHRSTPNLTLPSSPKFGGTRSDGGSAFSKALAGFAVQSSLQH